MEDTEGVPRGWFEFLPYTYFSYERPLFCRYATNKEDEGEVKRSKDYQMYSDAKRQFEEGIAREVTAERYFTTMEYYKLINRNKAQQLLNRNRPQRNDRGQARDRTQRGNWDRGDDFRGSRNSNRNDRWNRDDDRANNWGNRGNNRRDDWNDYPRNRNEDFNDDNIRSREKRNTQNDDNFSIVSRGSRVSAKSNRRANLSFSVCSREESHKGDERDDGFSFILQQDELSNSMQHCVTDFNNLGLDEDSPSPIRKNE